ncbi:UDP-N-acetylmuramoyl-L-alanine--D-glutamate ligase [Iamia majanohamensis]|uniref:UDP-N-acetylmuramoylalanine--D-glutamate ligase n=1 Tax=Iamia majanohamensis TaxID=467976 RepID=A0AAE9Y6G7_9ACTN|nr:UDP-N-acetylmuramoyl-L-alanine--D-glutamate ligase [Iamia majanohamensis]WCO65223.1 UDP-N-acetylmuramoyl-L-alanine--D-glutamate ligase [Iamia majanohamensis]
MRDDRPTVLVGLGVTGRAVARALARRGLPLALVDDRPATADRALAADLDVALHEAPDVTALGAILDGAGALVPAPGLPEAHPALALAAERGVPVVGELDLAAAWDARPCVAVTGTDGKTTVTTLVRDVLVASGVAAVDAGNTEVPLVEAIDDPAPEVFVVEASSFRLAPLRAFAPVAAAWLNFGPDHQDVHRDLARYEAAKANVWRGFGPDQVAVANRDDPVVAGHAAGLPRVETFGLGPAPADGGAHWSVVDGALQSPEGDAVVAVAELARDLPHDLANAQAAAALARAAGATPAGTAAGLRGFRHLPHRVQLLGEAHGVRWYDDSKATAPHATLAALSGFPSAVLIAGGRNKGLDLGALVAGADHIRAVVALGEAADEVAAAFAGVRPVVAAATMDEAAAAAADTARPGDVVLLSPACASFDQYRGYAERGDDFARAAAALGVRPADHREVSP